MRYFSNIYNEQNYEHAEEIKKDINISNKHFKIFKNIERQNRLKDIKISFKTFFLKLNPQITEENINYILTSILSHFTIHKNELYYFSYEDKTIQKINSDSEFLQYFNSKIFYLNNDYFILTNLKSLLVNILKNKISLLNIFQPSYISAETNELTYINTNWEIIKDIECFDILTPYFIAYGLNDNFNRRNFFTVNNTVILNSYNTLTEDLFKNIFTPYEYEKNNKLFYKFFSNKGLFKKLFLPNKKPLYFTVENKFFEIKFEKKNFSYKQVYTVKPFGVYFNFKYLLSIKYFDIILEYLCSKNIDTLKNILNLCYEVNFNLNPPKAYIIKINEENKFNLLYYLSTLFHQNIIITDTNKLLNLSENSAAFLLNNSISFSAPIVINNSLKLGEKKAQKITDILKGTKISVDSSIQKTICYKNNVHFIFIDCGASDFKHLISALKNNNIAITKIDLTNINFNSYINCFSKFHSYYVQTFSFACTLYGHYLETNKTTDKKTSKKGSKNYQKNAVFEFIENFCSITESEKDFIYSKELYEKFNQYNGNLPEKINIGPSIFTRIVVNFPCKSNNNFKIYAKEHHSTKKRAMALFGIKFLEEKFNDYLKTIDTKKDLTQSANTEEDFNDFIKEFLDYINVIFNDINKHFENGSYPLLFSELLNPSHKTNIYN